MPTMKQADAWRLGSLFVGGAAVVGEIVVRRTARAVKAGVYIFALVVIILLTQMVGGKEGRIIKE